MDKLKYFESEFNTQGRRGENMMLRRWAVGPSVNILFPEHISESTCPIVFKFYTQHLYGKKYWADYSHIAHTCSLRSLVVPFQVFGP